MAGTYYWFAWAAFIMSFFFLNSRSVYKDGLIIFLLIQMISFTFFMKPYENMSMFLCLEACFGIYFWSERKQSVIGHLWAVLFIVLWSLIHILLLTNPVWYLFPGATAGLVLLMYIIHVFHVSLNRQIGLWILMNTLGILLVNSLRHPLGIDNFVDLMSLHTTLIKGIIILMVLEGVQFVRRSTYKIRRKKRRQALSGL
ncbi:hypothetical protein [Halobacillus campisalis]|uniref:Uncharacterized protein n=1 Tax=Halobacillus campisalis TaxID=435909 RepID=A0ABW2K3F8_9BACI|nr:hypothetical protein [Halobacillus campisalis]